MFTSSAFTTCKASACERLDDAILARVRPAMMEPASRTTPRLKRAREKELERRREREMVKVMKEPVGA